MSYSGFVNGETAAVLGGSLAYGGTAQGAVNAGSYGLTATGLTSGNYAISYASGRLAVSPARLTITANSFVVPRFSLFPTLTYGVAGLVGDDDAASMIEGELETAAIATVPGSYAISLGSLRTTSPIIR